MKEKKCSMVQVVLMVVFAIYFSNKVIMPIFASTLEELRGEQQQLEDQYDITNEVISDMNSEMNLLQSQIGVLDNELVLILASISMLEEEVTNKEMEIQEAQIAYNLARVKEEEHYKAMMIRIQCMYEKGETSYVEIFMNTSNFAEVLNKVDYIEQLYVYDRNLLEAYTEIKEEVASAKEVLETERMALQVTLYEYEEEQSALDELLDSKKSEVDNYEVVLAQAKQDAAAYQLKIEQQMAKIQQLEEEERKRAEAEAAQNQGNTSSSSSSSNSSVNGQTVITNATGSALGKEIAMYAIQFVGNPYVLGGTSLTNGADCSGFTYSVYKAFGYNIPRTSTDQRSAGVGVSYAEAQPGDLICYSGHVALYLGDGKIVHASSESTGIKYGTATYRTILAVRRIV